MSFARIIIISMVGIIVVDIDGIIGSGGIVSIIVATAFMTVL